MHNLTYKSIDVMKKSKDVITAQLTSAEKANLIACLATAGITHIAISTPMDIQSEFVAFGSTPSPRTISAETQDWCDLIHAQLSIYGEPLKVIHRGTFCGVEAIYGAGYIDGGLSLGTQASAPTDGTATLLGRYYKYLFTNVGITHVLDGDIFCPIPEGTTHAFDGHYWWPGGTQANFDAAYAAFHVLTTTFGTSAGKSLVFMTHNNFSELASGWMDRALFTDQNMAGADYYGQRQGSTAVNPADYVRDWQQLYQGKDSASPFGNNNAAGIPQFWGEWGDLPNAVPAGTENDNVTWAAWLNSFYRAITDNLVSPYGPMVGFNYWGGWESQNTSIVDKAGSGASSVYTLNFRGNILKTWFSTVASTSQFGITATWKSNWMHLVPRQSQYRLKPSQFSTQSINSLGFEGYIKDGTSITFSLYKDFAENPSLTFTFGNAESDQAFITGGDLGAFLGDNPLGLEPLGTISDPDPSGDRHFKFRVYFPDIYSNYISIGVESSGLNQSYEVTRIGIGSSEDILVDSGTIKDLA